MNNTLRAVLYREHLARAAVLDRRLSLLQEEIAINRRALNSLRKKDSAARVEGKQNTQANILELLERRADGAAVKEIARETGVSVNAARVAVSRLSTKRKVAVVDGVVKRIITIKACEE